MDTNNIRGSLQERKSGRSESGMMYGYIRVSTLAQHDDRQRIAMEEFGISADCLFADKQSGKDFDRPAYNEMMARLSSGDTVVVKSLNRLGRDYEEMIRQLDIITREKNAAIVILDMPLIDTRHKQSDDLTGKFITKLNDRANTRFFSRFDKHFPLVFVDLAQEEDLDLPARLTARTDEPCRNDTRIVEDQNVAAS